MAEPFLKVMYTHTYIHTDVRARNNTVCVVTLCVSVHYSVRRKTLEMKSTSFCGEIFFENQLARKISSRCIFQAAVPHVKRRETRYRISVERN